MLSIASSNLNGASVSYKYDQLNRLSIVTDNAAQLAGANNVLTTYGYDAAGNLKSVAYPNSVTSTYSYDLLNRLTTVTATTPTAAVAQYRYTLGAAGNRTAVSELSGRSVQYGYDDIYRLTSESITCGTAAPGCGGSVSYNYDLVGNRTQITSTLGAIPSSGTLFYDANDRTATDNYDANGNTISSGGVGNAYDFENHLVQHGAVTVVYDGDGNRVSETAGGTTTNYLVDALNPTGYAQVVDELQSGLVTRSYAYGLQLIDEGQLVAGSWKLSFYGYDGHGSVRYLTDSTGAVTDTYDYDAFGNLLTSTGTTPNTYLFAGESYDSALGVYYNRARYYSPSSGRFLTIDAFEGKIADPRSLHKYLYVAANPIDHADPTGHDWSIGAVITAIGVIGVLATASYLTYKADQKNTLVEVDRYAYEETDFGVHIVLGAHTLLRRPHYPEYRWIQTVTTNAIVKSARGYAQPDVPFNDPQPPDDDKPYFWTDAEEGEHQHQYGFDTIFEDTPSRDPAQYPDVHGTIYWKASLDLVGVDPPDSLNYKPIIHVSYGFSVTQTGSVHTDPLLISKAQE